MAVRKFLLIAASIAALMPGQASANYAAAQAHAQAMNDIAATPPWSDGSGEGDAEWSGVSGTDWAAYAEEQERIDKKLHEQRLKTDPIYAAMYNGKWFYPGDADPSKRPFCSATFVKGTAVVTIMESAGDDKGAFIGFSSGRVPKSATLEKVALTLNQTGEAAQSVQGFNTTLQWADLGMVMFAVPSMDALLGGMEDVHRFDVSMNGRQVFSGEWSGGTAARDTLRECVAVRRKANG